jgi:hypothetical protein
LLKDIEKKKIRIIIVIQKSENPITMLGYYKIRRIIVVSISPFKLD